MKEWILASLVVLIVAPIQVAAPAKDEHALAEAILDKALKAIMGKEKLRGKLAFVENSEAIIRDGDEKPIASFTQALSYSSPSQWHVEFVSSNEGGNRSRVFVIDDKQGWIREGNETKEMTTDEVCNYTTIWTDALGVLQISLLKTKGYHLAPLESIKVGDHRAVGISFTRDGEAEIQFFFDSNSGLPLKRVVLQKTLNVETLFDDYKEFDGFQMPTKRLMQIGGQLTSEQKLTRFKTVDKFDEKTFTKPE